MAGPRTTHARMDFATMESVMNRCSCFSCESRSWYRSERSWTMPKRAKIPNSAKTIAVTKSGDLTIELFVEVKYVSNMGAYATTNVIQPAACGHHLFPSVV